jgi:hypothetical protein
MRKNAKAGGKSNLLRAKSNPQKRIIERKPAVGHGMAGFLFLLYAHRTLKSDDYDSKHILMCFFRFFHSFRAILSAGHSDIFLHARKRERWK